MGKNFFYKQVVYMQEILTQKEIDMIVNSLNDNGSNIVSNESKVNYPTLYRVG